MRTVTIICLMAIAGVLLCQPAIPGGDVTIYKQGKNYYGWFDDQGRIVIYNARGKTMMFGHVSKIGGIELHDADTGATFVGKVNPMGNGRLTSPGTGDSFRIELIR